MRRFDRFLQNIRIARVTRYVKPGARVLDIGCADGPLHRSVNGIASYVGVDPDAPMSESSTSDTVRFVRGTFPNAAIDAQARFDVITALAVLEHVPPGSQAAFARACAEHLAPGGCVTITVPSPAVDSIIGLMKRVKLLDGMHDEEHYGYDVSSTPALFEAAGLRLERHSRFELGLNHLFVFRSPNP